MTIANKFFVAVMVFVASVASASAFAEDYRHSTPGISGYDPVAYFTDGKPMKGTGYHVAVFEGVTYLFANKEHKQLFEANPQKYVPAYGGYCAYGVYERKKFFVDPEAWTIVQGKLYLNLDKDVRRIWQKDIPGYIAKADAIWPEIKDKAPGDL
jgi:YHS domain-containing protein